MIFKSCKWPQYAESNWWVTALPKIFFLQKWVDRYFSFAEMASIQDFIQYGITVLITGVVQQDNNKLKMQNNLLHDEKCRTLFMRFTFCAMKHAKRFKETFCLNGSARAFFFSQVLNTCPYACQCCNLECYLQKLYKSETIKSQRKM